MTRGSLETSSPSVLPEASGGDASGPAVAIFEEPFACPISTQPSTVTQEQLLQQIRL